MSVETRPEIIANSRWIQAFAVSDGENTRPPVAKEYQITSLQRKVDRLKTLTGKKGVEIIDEEEGKYKSLKHDVAKREGWQIDVYSEDSEPYKEGVRVVVTYQFGRLEVSYTQGDDYYDLMLSSIPAVNDQPLAEMSISDYRLIYRTLDVIEIQSGGRNLLKTTLDER